MYSLKTLVTVVLMASGLWAQAEYNTTLLLQIGDSSVGDMVQA
jgi:hypothetical protein